MSNKNLCKWKNNIFGFWYILVKTVTLIGVYSLIYQGLLSFISEILVKCFNESIKLLEWTISHGITTKLS
jgi:hypothetical protein